MNKRELRERVKELEAAVEAYETALRIGVLVYPQPPDPRLAASPAHPLTMIGRLPPSQIQSTESGGDERPR